MGNILKNIKTAYIDTETLLTLLKDHKRPREAISRMVKKRELIRLKNGLFLIEDKININSIQVIPFEQVANILYGPSYVSMEWALSFYGMIPERVHTISSMTLGRNKQYHTPIGDFSYFTLQTKSYSIGITLKQSSDFDGGFLIATEEKAIADLVFKTCKNMTKQELKDELLESKRINIEMLQQLDKKLLEEIASSYNAKHVNYLLDLIGIL